jgi:hypothetical protein
MCTPQPSKVNLHDSTLCVDTSVHKSESVIVPEKQSEGVARTCEDISTNVTMSTPSVVSSDMQVGFEEREPPILQLVSPVCALSLQEDILVPTTSEEPVIAIGTVLELQSAMENFCESTPLLVPSCDLSCTTVSAPCYTLLNSNFDHVVLMTHKEVLARIQPVHIVYSIMLNKPINLTCAMNKISEISYLNSSTYAYCFTFNLVGEYIMSDDFLVDHIYITCDRIAELKRDVFSNICYVSKYKIIYLFVPRRPHDNMNFTYICNFSCVLSTGNTHHVKTDTTYYIYIYTLRTRCSFCFFHFQLTQSRGRLFLKKGRMMRI